MKKFKLFLHLKSQLAKECIRPPIVKEYQKKHEDSSRSILAHREVAKSDNAAKKGCTRGE